MASTERAAAPAPPGERGAGPTTERAWAHALAQATKGYLLGNIHLDVLIALERSYHAWERRAGAGEGEE